MLGLLAGAALVAGALAPPAPSLDTLVVGTLADPVTLRPHQATDLVSAAVVGNVCEPLVRYRAGRVRPEAALATSWATVDGREWVFTLREGVRFHDGTPFDADAVVANLADLNRERRFAGRATRLGPRVVAVRLDRPNAALLATLAQPFFAMQSPRALEGASPVGTGAFRFASAAPGLVRLEANPGHWAGPPRLQALEFRRFPGEGALLSALRTGAVDVTAAVGQGRAPMLEQTPGITFESRTGLNLAYLSLNNEREPFRDRRVRHALARGIDRPALVERALAGHGVPARNPLPPSIWAYSPRTKELRLDSLAARRLLAQAGFPDGLDTSLLFVDTPRPYMANPAQVAEMIRRDLSALGVRVRVERAASWGDYLDRGRRGAFDMAVFGWQADTMDPNDFLVALLGEESIGDTNRSRFHSPALQALLDRGRRTGDPEERRGIYLELQDLFQKEMPWVPLYHVSSFTAYRASVQGLATEPTGLVHFDRAWKRP